MAKRHAKQVWGEIIGDDSLPAINLVKLRLESLRARRQAYVQVLFSVLSVLLSLLGTAAAAISVSVSFSSIPQIPKAYVYFVAIIVSSVAGISIVFLLTRGIYQRRKKQRLALIEDLRKKEKELFKDLQHDFQSMLKAHTLDARSTVRTH